MPDHLLMIGAGNMGGAMLSRWLASGLDPARVTVVRPSGRGAGAGVRVLTDPATAPPHPAMMMLGVKPQKLGEVVAAVRSLIGPDTVLVSMLAGVTVATLRARFPGTGAVLRVMPNTPVAIGRGIVGLFADGIDGAAGARIAAFFAPLGHIEWVADEAQLDIVTALSGSGPAFLFRFIDALAAGAATLGLRTDQALRLALATVDGAAGLAIGSDEDPGALADRVASPAGSTRAGLDVLDGGDALRTLVAETLAAATRRNRELGEIANG